MATFNINTLTKENNIVSVDKCGVTFKVGIGTLCDSPISKNIQHRLKCYINYIWFEYENYWYLTKIVYTERENKLSQINQLYSKEQVFDFLEKYI
jgi:hypothetical protein